MKKSTHRNKNNKTKKTSQDFHANIFIIECKSLHLHVYSLFVAQQNNEHKNQWKL